MKQKINELLDRPWTTRGYVKTTGIMCIIGMIFIGLWNLMLFWDDVKDWFNKKFGKKGSKKKINTTVD